MPHDTDSLAGWDRLISRARSMADDLDRRPQPAPVTTSRTRDLIAISMAIGSAAFGVVANVWMVLR